MSHFSGLNFRASREPDKTSDYFDTQTQVQNNHFQLYHWRTKHQSSRSPRNFAHLKQNKKKVLFNRNLQISNCVIQMKPISFQLQPHHFAAHPYQITISNCLQRRKSSSCKNRSILHGNRIALKCNDFGT